MRVIRPHCLRYSFDLSIPHDDVSTDGDVGDDEMIVGDNKDDESLRFTNKYLNIY